MHFEPSQISKMEIFPKTVNGYMPLTVFEIVSDVCHDLEYTSDKRFSTCFEKTLFLEKNQEVISTRICLPLLVKEEAKFRLSLRISHIAKLI